MLRCQTPKGGVMAAQEHQHEPVLERDDASDEAFIVCATCMLDTGNCPDEATAWAEWAVLAREG